MLFLARAHILCGYVYNAVCVDIERNLNLRNASGRCGDTVKRESAERCICRRFFTLALENVNFNRRLTVCRRREYLGLLYGDRCVSVDYLCADAAERFNTEGKRSNVEKEKILNLAAENAALDSRADCNAFIGVDSLEGFLAAEVLYSFLNSGDTCRTADKKNLIYL